MELGHALGVSSMSVVSSCPHSLSRFKHDLEARGMRLARQLHAKKHLDVLGDVVRTFLEESVSFELQSSHAGLEVRYKDSKPF